MANTVPWVLSPDDLSGEHSRGRRSHDSGTSLGNSPVGGHFRTRVGRSL